MFHCLIPKQGALLYYLKKGEMGFSRCEKKRRGSRTSRGVIRLIRVNKGRAGCPSGGIVRVIRVTS